MLYTIRRVSGDGNQPSGKAKLGIYTITQTLTVAQAATVSSWLDEGRNHRIKDGKAFRIIEYERWVIEIKSLKELNALGQGEGEHGIIISRQKGKPEFEIEIRDDYSE